MLCSYQHIKGMQITGFSIYIYTYMYEKSVGLLNSVNDADASFEIYQYEFIHFKFRLFTLRHHMNIIEKKKTLSSALIKWRRLE